LFKYSDEHFVWLLTGKIRNLFFDNWFINGCMPWEVVLTLLKPGLGPCLLWRKGELEVLLEKLIVFDVSAEVVGEDYWIVWWTVEACSEPKICVWLVIEFDSGLVFGWFTVW